MSRSLLPALVPIVAAASLGAVVARSRALRRVALAATVLVPLGGLGLAAGTHRTDAPARSSPKPGHLTILIPANNESMVIGDLLKDLALQDVLGRADAPIIRVIVVDDRSTDSTAEVANDALASSPPGLHSEVLRRTTGPMTKGGALHSVDVGAHAGTTVVVLDADGRVEPSFADLVIASAEAGVGVGTARRRMMLPTSGRLARLLARLQDDEQTLDGELQLGRWNLGGASELRGNGMIVRADLLAAAGGWSPDALCEDLELTSRLYLTPAGPRPRWLPEVVVWEQPVTTVRALVRQRLRWAEGAVRRDVRITFPRLFEPRIPMIRRLDAAAYAAQTLLPFGALGALLAGRRGAALVGSAAVAYCVAALILAIDALRMTQIEGTRPQRLLRRASRAVAVVGFAALWLALTPVAWLRVVLVSGPVRFARTSHRSGFAPPEPVPSAGGFR